MKQAPGRFFPRSSRSASRRYLSGPLLARKAGTVLTRHQAWAGEVVQKFAVRLARSRTQSLIFQRSARQRVLSIQNFRRISLTLAGLSQQVFVARPAFIARTLVERLDSGALRTVLNATPYQRKKSRGPLQLVSPPQVSTAARPALAVQPGPHRDAAPAISTITTAPVIRLHERQLAAARLTGREIRETNQLRESVTIHRARRHEQISEMIMRKTQRIEDRAFASGYGAGQAAVILPPATKLTYSRPSHRVEKETAGARTMVSAPANSFVNVTGLTDEVMKQLDRRLVAAMERLGKT